MQVKDKVKPKYDNQKLWKNHTNYVKNFLLHNWSLWFCIMPQLFINIFNMKSVNFCSKNFKKTDFVNMKSILGR